jgi:hypothetical protein
MMAIVLELGGILYRLDHYGNVDCVGDEDPEPTLETEERLYNLAKVRGAVQSRDRFGQFWCFRHYKERDRAAV